MSLLQDYVGLVPPEAPLFFCGHCIAVRLQALQNTTIMNLKGFLSTLNMQEYISQNLVAANE
jgi:hypothetical protein